MLRLLLKLGLLAGAVAMGTSKLDNETLRGIETLALDIARSAGFRDFATLDHESPADSASKVMRTTGSAMDGKGTQEPAKDAAGGDTVLRAFHNRAPKDCFGERIIDPEDGRVRCSVARR